MAGGEGPGAGRGGSWARSRGCSGRSPAGHLRGLVSGELRWRDKQVVDPLPFKVGTLRGGRTERGVPGPDVRWADCTRKVYRLRVESVLGSGEEAEARPRGERAGKSWSYTVSL